MSLPGTWIDRLSQYTETTQQIVVDYLRRNPASTDLIHGYYGCYASLVLEICEREPSTLSVLSDPQVFKSIVKVTNSDDVQETVRVLFFSLAKGDL